MVYNYKQIYNAPKLQGGNADSRHTPRTQVLTRGNSPKTKRPAAFGVYRKKQFAKQLVVCGNEFYSRQLASTEFPSSFNALFRSMSCVLWDIKKLNTHFTRL